MQNTNYKRTTLTKCLLIFCREKAKPIQFFGKIDSEKNIKNFIVNNNNKICAWYLSSKWPVCRSIVNQTSGGTSRTKLSTLKQISSNIAPCFTITWLKYSCNKWILSIQIMGKCIFVVFRNFSPFNWRAKSVIYFLLLFRLTKRLRYATYSLETCCSYLGSIMHTYISMVNQTTSTS